MIHNKKTEGNREKKTKNGKTEKRKWCRVFLGILLITATAVTSLSGVNLLGDSASMKELVNTNNISEQGKLEESLEFQNVTDGYLQALKLYLDIRSRGSADGSFYTGKIEDMPFLQTGTGSKQKVVTLKEAAGWKGHHYDYDGYLKNYINGFEKYSQKGISIKKLTKEILSLDQFYFARGDWEKSKLYYTVAAGCKFSKKDWKRLVGKERNTASSKRYEGQETLLPGLQKESDREESATVKMLDGSGKVRLHSSYAKWLDQMYSGYAEGWLLYQMALACEKNFKGTGEDGTKYSAYYDDVMKDYRDAYCITDMYNIETNSEQAADGIVYVYGSGDAGDKATRISTEEKLYYNEGKSDFNLKNFLKDPDAYYNDADEQDDYRVYTESLDKYAEELKAEGKRVMKNALSRPWNVKKTLCSEVMAADVAQFMLSFGKGLENFLNKSQFLYSIKADGKSQTSTDEGWKGFVQALERNSVDEEKSSYDYEYAMYDVRGSIYKSNWYWEGFGNSGDLKQFMEKLTESHNNAYVVVGYDPKDITSPGTTSGMATLYQKYKAAQDQYIQTKKAVEQYSIVFGIGLICMLLSFFGLALTTERVCVNEKRFQKIPVEIPAVIALLMVYILNGMIYDLCHISDWEQTMEQTHIGNISIPRLADTFLIAAAALVVMILLLDIIRRIIQKRVIKHSVIRWCLEKGKTGGRFAGIKMKEFICKYRSTTAFVRYGIGMTAFGSLCILLWFVCLKALIDYYSGMCMVICLVGLPLLLAAGEAALFISMRNGIADEMLQEGAAKIAGGDISYKIELPEKAGKEQKKLADTINHIRQGLESAVEESLRSERMKTELITNVSHDIKTPLTSVINYVDLLKREHIDNERAKEYLDVLDRKAMRLKGLIEDLVEASKASSGTIELQITTLNYTELVNQTNGEFEEKFEEAGLSLVADISDQPVCFKGDGRRVFRILENLYGNVAKYALNGTRVYVNLYEKEDSISGKKMAVFSIKNISRERLNMKPDELMERFVRGDASRTTEGSGLGLYIANNLTELMEGKFEIRLDGDLFHVEVSFPEED